MAKQQPMQQPTHDASTEVVVVGAGPTGLLAAILLQRCGVKVRIVDKAQPQTQESRAFAIQAKTMELFLNIGLADAFLARGVIATGVQVWPDGKPAGELNFDDIDRKDTPYPFVFMVPQYETEAILREQLQQQNIAVEYDTEVVSFSQSADTVLVEIKNNAGERQQIHCAYLIGADGAHSIVRKTLGIPFAGDIYPQGFLLADCKINWNLDYEHIKIFLREKNLAVHMPLHGKEQSRIIALQSFTTEATAEQVEAGGAAPATLAAVEQALRQASGLEVTLSDATWVSEYRIHHRCVEQYAQGRVFLAGDAAHIHSPAGGQGMNTGLQDAANLVWKIALVLKGNTPDALLQSYHQERWPVGQTLLKFTDKLFGVMSSPKPWEAKLRNLLMPVMAKIISGNKKVRGKLFHFISQLGIHYHDVALFAESPAKKNDSMVGYRAPNGLITRHCDVFDLLQGYCFHVLAICRQALTTDEINEISHELEKIPTTVEFEIKTHFITHSLVPENDPIVRIESSAVIEAYGLTVKQPRAIFLVRPDGYIAYHAADFDVAKLNLFLRKWQKND